MKTRLLVLLLAVTSQCGDCLDNGLALTPPMGWLSWERFGCITDCKASPDYCISEKLYMGMADRLVADGYRDAGYNYINIDDCWALKQRDPQTHKLVADPDRFPSGIKALADYVHGKGLKLGIYGDVGNATCQKYPGSKDFEDIDAQTFADWGIDSLKMDGCNINVTEFPVVYPKMAQALNKTGRPILLTCEWAAYQNAYMPYSKIDYAKISETCNTCRVYRDVSDDWDRVKNVITSYSSRLQNFGPASGPGYFNDPDMVVVGNKGLSPSQEQAQMAMWAMFAAPLMLSADLRQPISNESRALMLNPRVIAIDQDKLGISANRQATLADTVSVWTRPILPTGSYAFALLNENDVHHGARLHFKLDDLGIAEDTPFRMTEVFSGKDMGVVNSTTDNFVYLDVNSVFFATLTHIG